MIAFYPCGGTDSDYPGSNRRLAQAGSMQRMAADIIAECLQYPKITAVLLHNLMGHYVKPGVFPKANGEDRLMWFDQWSLAVAEGKLDTDPDHVAQAVEMFHAAGLTVGVYIGSPQAFDGNHLAELSVYEPFDFIGFDKTDDWRKGDTTDRLIQRIRSKGQAVIIEPGLIDDGREYGEIDGTITNDRGMGNDGIRLETGDVAPLKRHHNHTIIQRQWTVDQLRDAEKQGHNLAARLWTETGKQLLTKD